MSIPPPIIMLLAFTLIWLSQSFVPMFNFALPFGLHPQRWLFAILFVVAGLVLEGRSILAFVKSKTTITPISPDKATTLITTGFYRFTRNPMYLGMLLMICGVGIWFSNWSLFAVAIGFVLYINRFQIQREEAALLNVFGDEYKSYQQRVRRWI